MPKHLRMFYKPGTAAGWLAALRWDFRNDHPSASQRF